MKLTRRVAQGLALLLAPTMLVGCGSSDHGSGGASGNVDKRLPDQVRKSGELVIGTSVGLPPYQYYDTDGKTVIGYEPDLMAPVAKKLGVDLSWRNDAFASLFSGLKTGRFDTLMNGITVTKQRQQDNDYVAYAKDAYGVLVQKGKTATFTKDTDFCGGTLSSLRGSTADTWVENLSKKCTAAGQKGVKNLPFDSGTQALLAVKTGRADGTTAQDAQLLYYEKESPDQYEMAKGIEYSGGYVGIVVPKGNAGMVHALMDGLQSSMADGSYTKVMKKWNLESLEITKPMLNPAES